ELVLQCSVGGRAREQRVPGGEDLVDETGLGDLRRPDRAAEPVVALEHAHPPALAREQRTRDQRIDPAPDRDRVVAPHSASAAATARRAISSAGSAQSESANASPNVPSSDITSTSNQPS